MSGATALRRRARLRGCQGSTQPAADADSDLEPIDWQQKVFIDSHKAAIEKAIESSDGACGTVLTACLSLATAYGAAIALVAPTDERAPLLVVTPFVLLAAGAVVALLGKAAGISLGEFATTGQVRSAVASAVEAKRRASWVAVGLAAVGVIFAGWVIFTTYGQPEGQTAGKTEIVFSDAGQAQFDAACGAQARPVRGSVTFDERWVTINLDNSTAESCAGIDTVTVPASSVSYTRSVP
jgi:hypothetical protein